MHGQQNINNFSLSKVGSCLLGFKVPCFFIHLFFFFPFSFCFVAYLFFGVFLLFLFFFLFLNIILYFFVSLVTNLSFPLPVRQHSHTATAPVPLQAKVLTIKLYTFCVSWNKWHNRQVVRQPTASMCIVGCLCHRLLNSNLLTNNAWIYFLLLNYFASPAPGLQSSCLIRKKVLKFRKIIKWIWRTIFC